MVECMNDKKDHLIVHYPEDSLNEIFVKENILTKTDIFLEEKVSGNLRRWHIILMALGVLLSITFLVCSLVKIRLPRTKAEIFADAKRKELLKKFQKKLVELKTAELDTMDYKKAVERLRQELQADTESLVHSEEMSITSIYAETPQEIPQQAHQESGV